MNEGLVLKSLVRTFTCERCGKLRQNSYRGTCPVCRQDICTRCETDHFMKEHNERERYQFAMETL